MLSAFKEQQHQYRALLDGMKVGERPCSCFQETLSSFMAAPASFAYCSDDICCWRHVEDAAAAQR